MTKQWQIQTLAIAEIACHPLLRTREWLNPSTVAEYSEAMMAGDEFPPLLVFSDGAGFLLVEGFLRFEAAKLARVATLPCEVRQGDLRAAILASVGANATHGARRTNADKRFCVAKLLQDPEWAKWSNCEIARRCMVSDVFVGRLRDSLTPKVRPSDSLTPNVWNGRKYVNKDGAAAVMNVTAIGGRKQTDGTPLRIAGEVVDPTAKSENVMSLADHAEDYREQFVAALAEVERLLAAYPPMALVRGNSGADSVLARRMEAIGKKHLSHAATLMYRPHLSRQQG
jgi:hypothetical protein